jgi:hypothetical protein
VRTTPTRPVSQACCFLRAGSFCTKDYAVGVAANALDDNVDFASFFVFGYGGTGSSNNEELPVMRKVGRVTCFGKGHMHTWGCHVPDAGHDHFQRDVPVAVRI